MVSHPQEGVFNMGPCWACGEKRICHTETDDENRCNRKKQPPPNAVLWHPVNRNTHIKREIREHDSSRKEQTECHKTVKSLNAQGVEPKAQFIPLGTTA